jgi:flavin reductase (DIM6/NTAB) family NADH-FMN oxidoreductase RutF
MVTNATPGQEELSTAFRNAMRRFAATVTIVTACDHERRHGMTATAVTSISMEPPSLLVCVNQKALLHEVLGRARHFCVNVLNRHQAGLSAAFSGATSLDRFAFGEWGETEDGVPFLKNAQSNLFCRKVGALPFGTHTILIGAVEAVGLGEADAPLLYQNAAYCVAAPPLDPIAA